MTVNETSNKRGIHVKKMPYAFPEQRWILLPRVSIFWSMDFRPIYTSMETQSYLNRLKQYIAENSLCEDDAGLIKDFISFRLATRSISSKRLVKIAGTLCLWRTRFLYCNFTDITDKQWIDSAGAIRYTNLGQNTKRDYLIISRSFLLWLQEEGLNRNLSRDGIMKVKMIPVQRITKTPDMLLTDDDVYAMLHHPQCKPVTAALIAILYYTGMRPSEALNLKWSDLEFTKSLLKIRINDTKMRKIRYAPTFEAIEYVAYWREHYPKKISGGPDGDNPVFVCRENSNSKQGRPYASMSSFAARKQVSTLAMSALGRKINLYIFRSSDITNSAAKGVPDSVNKAIHWGNQSTKMLETYLLLKDSQIDEALLKRAGVDVDDENSADNKSGRIFCRYCNTMNAPGSDYCRFCGNPISKTAIQRHNKESRINEKQHDVISLAEKIKDVAEIFGMSTAEFTDKIMKIKSLDDVDKSDSEN